MRWTLLSLATLLATMTTASAQAPRPTVRTGLAGAFLAGPMAKVEEVVFAARPSGSPSGDGHWYANFGYYGPDANRKAYGEGAHLYKYNLRSHKLQSLVDDAHGGIRDPQVDYDGRRILFSYRKAGSGNYHLYEIQSDGSGLRQLTGGPYDDIEPTFLPSGEIVFVSSRCKRWVNCWLTQVAVLYRCNADGSGIRAVSSNNEQDNTPWPLPDGRILYTRWEYVDRSQVDYHHLWVANPDGTGQMIYFGNLLPGTVMIDAKPVPDSRKVVAIFSPGHGKREHEGAITLVDPRAGPDVKESARRISATDNYRDPWAFTEDCFMAATGASLVVMNGRGEQQTVFDLPKSDTALKLQLHEPRPLISRRRERVIPPRIDPSRATGSMLVSNVYRGRNMQGVKPGEIRKLLVLETLPMPIHYTGGMEPVSYGGTFTLERILGTVPVAEDGSAYFEVPALRSVFFVALDERDMAVKRMQSFTMVEPGETASCAGCHEDRVEAPPASGAALAALRHPPSAIAPIKGVPDVFDFPRDIQPILNRNCVSCHDYNRREGGVILSGDRGPIYSHSYFTLTIRNQVADGRNRAKSNYAPYALGSSASPLMAKLEPSHHGVKTTEEERRLVRLWIETGAPYPGTYAALGTGMIGGYTENQLARPDWEWPATRAAASVMTRRCASCHTEKMPLPQSVSDDQKLPPWDGLRKVDLRRQYSRHLLFNLTRPEMSMLLLAPLAREAGGYGACKGGGFTSREDPDYRTMLTSIQEAGRYLDSMKRFDMPGFVPRVDWVREMKRFGILPQAHDPAAPVDYYAREREYWESLWYRAQ